METETTILVVDDQPEIAVYIEEVLTAVGYQILTASDGRQALAILQAQSVDLILADIVMPELNGYQLFERVRQNPQWLTIPFIFLTGRSLDSDIRHGKELGVDDYLAKPFLYEDLLATIQGKLRRARQLAQSPQQQHPIPMAEQSELSVGQLRINVNQHRVWVKDQELELSATSFKILAHLAINRDKVVSVQELVKITHQLEIDQAEAGALLRPLIHTLRRQLGVPVGKTGLIENVRGVGYRLVVPDG